MAMNRVQFQAGLSMMEFMDRYGSEDQCEAALMASRWPQGFACPACGCAPCGCVTLNRQRSFGCGRHGNGRVHFGGWRRRIRRNRCSWLHWTPEGWGTSQPIGSWWRPHFFGRYRPKHVRGRGGNRLRWATTVAVGHVRRCHRVRPLIFGWQVAVNGRVITVPATVVTMMWLPHMPLRRNRRWRNAA